MDITWHGHACVRMRGREATIVSDPFGRGIGYPPLKLTADVVSISHHHPNHDAVEVVQPAQRPPRVLDGPGEYEVSGAMITGVATFRDKDKGKTLGKNTAYLFELDDLSVCHLGLLGHALNPTQQEALKDVDVLLVPTGSDVMLDASMAAEVVSQIEPRVVVPFYVGQKERREEALERFCRELAATDLGVEPRLTVTKSNLPAETKVVLLGVPEGHR